MKNKRGISPIVATIALVLLTFAAIALIAGFLVPLVKNELSDGSSCVGLEEHFNFEDVGYNCYRQADNNRFLYGVSVRANSQEDVNGLVFVFTTPLGETKSAVVEENSADFGNANGQIRRVNTALPLEVPNRGETRTYVYNNSLKFYSVKVIPKLESGNTCDVNDEIELNIVCDEEVVLTV